MAYIAPNSTVWLYQGVPLDSNYDNVYWAANKTVQKQSFDAYLAYTFTAQSYCRATGSAIKVQRNPDDLINCNYMAFRNTSFGDKIFYAFIDEVAYINNSTAEIRFTIDDMQSYCRDVTILPSLVEREHSATDEIGDSITPEPVVCSGEEIANYTSVFTQNFPNAHLYTVLVTAFDFLNPEAGKYIFQATDADSPVGIKGASLPGQYNVLNVTSDYFQDFYSAMTNYISKVGESGILGMYTIPSYAFKWNADPAKPWLTYNVGLNEGKTYVQTLQFPSINDTLDGYKPVNNKLYTYPYNYLEVRSGTGETKDFRYEFFSRTNTDGTPTDLITFTIRTSGVTPDQTVYCFPVFYRGSDLANDWSYALEYSTFPASSFTSSQYTEYIGTNSNKLLASQIARVVSAVTTAAQAKADPVSAMGSLLGNAMSGANEFASLQDLKRQTNTYGGTAKGFYGAFNHVDYFQYMRMSVNKTVAKMYDDYFTRYGYNVGKIKIPNFVSFGGRERFNYIKTNSVGVVGKNAPSDAVAHIKQILNSGVTMWYKLAEVGHFELTNTCIQKG